MNFTWSIIVIFAVALALLGSFVFARIKKWKLNIPRKAMAGVLAVVAFVRYMYKREAFLLMNTQGLNMWSPFGNDIASTMLNV